MEYASELSEFTAEGGFAASWIHCSWMANVDWVDIPNSSAVYRWYVAIYAAIASVSELCCVM